MPRALTTDEWVARVKARRGDRYDYRLAEYRGSGKKLQIVCSVHGVFEQIAQNHENGADCPACAKENRAKPPAQFLAEARRAHGDRYDYSQAEYKGDDAAIRIGCPAHGVFVQKARVHLSGSGCPQCGYARTGAARAKAPARFVAEARQKHGDRYDYSRTKFTSVHEKVEIVCPEHGPFWQHAGSHLLGRGCKQCADAQRGANKRLLFDIFLARASAIHGESYDYASTCFEKATEHVTIRCPKHGPFRQTPDNHLQGRGCPACGLERTMSVTENKRSREEIELFDWIAALCPDATHGAIDSTTWLYDVVVPSRKLVIEYNGVYWHSYPRITNASKHIVKRRHAENLGYRMITIWSDEWQNNRPRIEALLRRALGAERPRIVGARQCRIVEIEPAQAREFHAAWHIQGGGIGGSHHYGVFLGEELLAAATFRKGGVDLDRYTVREGVALAGALQRILKRHVAATGVATIVTYCDRDHFTGAGYEAAGFIKTGCHAHLSYAVGPARQARHRWMKHKAPANFPGATLDMSQREIDVNASQGVFACYNSGVDRWLWSALL